ncbi:MAG TPA: hypothetical protein VGE74_30020 [Gemmata sp.]
MSARQFLHGITISSVPPAGRLASASFDALALTDLPFTGTPDGTKFLRDDGSWQAAPGAVDSVNGYTGAVTLSASDVGADPSGTAASAVSAHVAAPDPHTQYALESALGTASALASDTDGTLSANSDSRLATQKAVKTYVDTLSAGLRWKAPCRVATTVAGTLATSFENGDTVDGVTLATGDRILIKNQSSGAENGIYVVNASGAPTRAADADSATELDGAAVFVTQGSTNADKAFTQTADSITVGTTALVWTQFSGSVGALLASNNLSDLANAATARTNLGATTLGSALFVLTNPSAIRFLRINADNTVTARTAAEMLSDLGAGLDITGLTATDAAKDDYVPIYDTSAGANRKLSIERLAAFARLEPGGRLTVTSGTPVVTSSTASTALYYTPYKHDLISLWDGTRWVLVQFFETGIVLGTMSVGAVYDVFAYLSAGAAVIEKLAWSTATARATGISIQDGRYCKTGDKTRLYLGTFQAVNTTQTIEASASATYVWNMYNRVLRTLYAQETTDSWTYASNAWRPMNNSASNRVQFVRGLDEDAVRATVYGSMNETTAGVNSFVGIGLDSTSANSAQLVNGGRATHLPLSAMYGGLPGIGAHYLQALERVYNGVTATFYGDAGVSSAWQAGIVGEVWC